jgi:LysR family carnitine catabolism transcriptional activator
MTNSLSKLINEDSILMHRVTLRQLRAFVAIASDANFTRAARRLNVSQSALTIQIRQFESAVGLRLFDRTSRSVELTAAGSQFFPAARRLLEDLGNALNDLHSVAQGQQGSVTVVAGASVISLVIAPAIARLYGSYPGISVRIIEHVGDEVAKQIAKGHADFGLANFVRASDTVDSEFLLKDRIGILCRTNHPLARKRAVTWGDIGSHPFAMTLGQGSGIRDMLVRNSGISGTLPEPKYETSNLSVLLSIVEQGVCIALLPGLAAFSAVGRELVFRPVSKPAAFRELFFVSPRRRSLPPAARGVASFIIAEFQKLKRARTAGIHVTTSDLSSFRRKLAKLG